MNNISAVIAGFLLIVVVLLSLQVLELNKEINASGNIFAIEVNKYVDCQNTLEGTQIDLQRALKSQ